MKWNVETYNKNAAFVSKYGQDVVVLLNPQPGERILDLGCGDGQLAEKILSDGCEVVAIDSSKEMIAAAQKCRIDARVVSGEDLDYQNQFDAVFSNAALHWMKDPKKVLRNVYKSLKPGGRFCGEMGGKNNVNTIISEIYDQLSKIGLDGDNYNPWYFPTKEEYTMNLRQAGFIVTKIEKFERITPLPTDVAGWLKTFAEPFLQNIPVKEHSDFINAVMDGVSDTLQNTRGEWSADYHRIRFLAHKDL